MILAAGLVGDVVPGGGPAAIVHEQVSDMTAAVIVQTFYKGLEAGVARGQGLASKAVSGFVTHMQKLAREYDDDCQRGSLRGFPIPPTNLTK